MLFARLMDDGFDITYWDSSGMFEDGDKDNII